MYRPDEYLAMIVSLMFLWGIVLIIQTSRQQSRIRAQWTRVAGQGEERTPNSSRSESL